MLEQHLDYVKHHPLSYLRCVASDKCKRRFASPSALLHHLESGTCCSGVNRQTINKLVQDNDLERIISSGPTSLDLLSHKCSGSEWSSSTGTPVLTPTSSVASSPVPEAITESTNEQPLSFLSLGASPPSINGVLTSTSSQILSKAGPSLFLQHNESPSEFSARSLSHNHNKSPLFHSPGALARSTPHAVSPKYFTTLSGLAQHIESGACGEGPATLMKAMEFVQGRLEMMGLGRIRLLE